MRRVAGWCVRVLALAAVSASLALGVAGCGSGGSSEGSVEQTDGLQVVAVTTYLADIAQNVAGDRLTVASLIPEGSDSHTFEPSPQDAKLLAEADIVIRDLEGLTPLVDDLIDASGHDGQVVVDAAAGLSGLPVDAQENQGHESDTHEHATGDIDPHFWLDPTNVITYAQNIRESFVAVDPDGADVYRANAGKYVQQLEQLDAWIVQQVEQIPAERRLLVTNHEEFGYFAARYGFQIVGTVIPGASSEAAPSAQQLSDLIGEIRATGAPAIFLEAGSNADLADEVARETGVTVVSDLYTHSLSEEAPTYIDMMRWDVNQIVEVLK